ncbi:MAG: anacyclamide/piricyclamide family prenylated cyclic peptide [Crocosphaera sp.]
MKTKKLSPRNVAPVKRKNTATISHEVRAIAPSVFVEDDYDYYFPFAGDNAE